MVRVTDQLHLKHRKSCGVYGEHMIIGS